MAAVFDDGAIDQFLCHVCGSAHLLGDFVGDLAESHEPGEGNKEAFMVDQGISVLKVIFENREACNLSQSDLHNHVHAEENEGEENLEAPVAAKLHSVQLREEDHEAVDAVVMLECLHLPEVAQ